MYGLTVEEFLQLQPSSQNILINLTGLPLEELTPDFLIKDIPVTATPNFTNWDQEKNYFFISKHGRSSQVLAQHFAKKGLNTQFLIGGLYSLQNHLV